MADSSFITPMHGVSNVLLHPREQLRQLRERMAQAVEQLINAIDDIDGDPDMEPSLGSVQAIAEATWLRVPSWPQGTTDDREDECEDEGAQCDDEGAIESDEDIVSPYTPYQAGSGWTDGVRGEKRFIREEC